MEHKKNQQVKVNEPCRLWLAGLIMLIAISGCSSSLQATTRPVATGLPLSQTPRITSPTPVPPTRVFTQTATLIVVTLAPTSTSTSTPTPTLTWTPEAPSPTLGPTLAETDKEALVLDLLHNNAGCELPCWWGFTPGVTTWETARDFFLSYGEGINDRFKRQNAFIGGLGLEKYSFGVSVAFFIDHGVVRVINVDSGTSPNVESIIYGDPFFEKAMQRYTLSQIFSRLGKPEQVLVRVDADRDIRLPDYHILLFYPKNGVLVEYDGRSDTSGDNLCLCPAKTMISMWLWPPEDSLTLEDVFSMSAGYQPDDRKLYLSHFRSWEEVSGKNIDEFVETFKVENACFNTLAAAWGRK